jgi:hypothetical protein
VETGSPILKARENNNKEPPFRFYQKMTGSKRSNKEKS